MRGERCNSKRAAAALTFGLLLTMYNTLGLALPATDAPAVRASAPGATQGAVSTQVGVAARREVAEALAQKLVNEYAYAEPGKKMAEVVRKNLAHRAYDKIKSADEFARALQADIRAVVNDKHLRVSFDPGAASAPMQGPRPGGPPPGMFGEMRKQNGGIRRAQILAGNVGYLEVNGMLPMANDAIAAAFAFLHNTDALIIDLRGNGGGTPETVAYYMSYLSEGKPYVVMRVHSRMGPGVRETQTTDVGDLSYGAKKPVFVLTSYLTFSGGEELAYDVQSFKRGITVGETTGGGANPGGMEPLGHGFTVFMPTGYGESPATGTNWESVGVKPNMPVPADSALVVAQHAAVELLRATTTDPRQLGSLQALTLNLASEIATGAESAARHLTDAQLQLVGSYVPVDGRGPSVAIVEKDNYLVLQPSRSRPPSPLEQVRGNTYHMMGLPEDFTATFSSTSDGKIQLLVDEGGGGPPPSPMEKR